MKLRDICKYRREKIELKKIKKEQYISTDNMLPNFSGVGKIKSFPNVEKVNKCYKNDILISNIRPYFKKMIISDIESGCSPDILVIETISKDVNPKFLYYRLMADDFFDYVILTSKGTKMPRGDKDAIMNFELILPNIRIQNKIVEILETIDKKIKLNNQINNNLHELCNNLYFELIEQLNENNSSVYEIKDIAKCILGGTPSRAKKEYWKGNINWINSGEVNKFRIIEASEKITELGLNKTSTTLLPKETTVLAITGATLGQVSRLEIEACTNQSVIGIVPNNKILNNYLYLSIINNIKDIILKQTGGAQQHINKNDIETHKLVIPNDYLINKFDLKVFPLLKKISSNYFENKSLSQLRDTLLPKLMNGEIDLDKIEI